MFRGPVQRSLWKSRKFSFCSPMKWSICLLNARINIQNVDSETITVMTQSYWRRKRSERACTTANDEWLGELHKLKVHLQLQLSGGEV